MKKPETKTSTVQPAKKAVLGKIEPVKVAAAAPAKEKKPPFNPVKFFTEVRQEARRITWTSRKETWITTVMVLIMVMLAGLFFLVVDKVLDLGMYFLSVVSK